jgi:hypothetical protein
VCRRTVALALLRFPVSPLAAGVALAGWLGYQTDEPDLRPADEQTEMESGEPWEHRRW